MAAVKDNLARKQIFIPANVPKEEIVLRVAAYCRVSTDSDDQINSFTAQNSHYMEMITAHDRWELVDIYADEGITGTSAKKRKDFQRLLADCRNGRIDKVLSRTVIQQSLPRKCLTERLNCGQAEEMRHATWKQDHLRRNCPVGAAAAFES